MRGYLQDSLVPQEDANKSPPAPRTPVRAHAAEYDAFNINDVALRGGNLMINPKVELRFPVIPPFDSVLFIDAGNLWAPPDETTAKGRTSNDNLGDFVNGFNLRTTGGTGIRAETPVGPVAVDVGVNLSLLFSSPNDPRRAYEGFHAFHFAIGLF